MCYAYPVHRISRWYHTALCKGIKDQQMACKGAIYKLAKHESHLPWLLLVWPTQSD